MKKLMEMKKAQEQAKQNKENDGAAPADASSAGPSLAIDKAAVLARSPPKGAGTLAYKTAPDALAGSLSLSLSL